MNDVELMAKRVKETPIIELYAKLSQRETNYITKVGNEFLSTLRKVIDEKLNDDYEENTDEMLDALTNGDLAVDILCDDRIKDKLVEYFESII